MVKKPDTVKYEFTHLMKILREKHGWFQFPLITKESVVKTQWEGQPVKHIKL